MNKLHPFIKEFIEKHIELIDNNNYNALYEEWCEICSASALVFAEVYKALLDCGIDMLLYMKSIPCEFFYHYVGDELIIPDNITHLDQGAFRECNIDKLVIPPSITSTGGYLFEDSYIDIITWTGECIDLSDNATLSCDFEGTVWNITKGSMLDMQLSDWDNPPFTINYI